MKTAYGGVIFDENGRVLLREPLGHYGGYWWTFPKGGPDNGESPEETALREVREEAGVKASIICRIPGTFKGDTTENIFYLMKPVEAGLSFHWETINICWATYEEAQGLISQSTTKSGKARDLAVLDAAFATLREMSASKETPESLFGLLRAPLQPLARATHEILCKLHPGCSPKVCAINSTPYVRYAPYRELFHLEVTKSTCRLLISPKLELGSTFEKLGIELKKIKKWDILKIESEAAVAALSEIVKSGAAFIS